MDDVTGAISVDSRVGKRYLKAGVGYGGACFPRDNRAFAAIISSEYNVPLHAQVTDEINKRNIDRIVELVLKHSDAGKSVGILGMAFKPGTGIVEESHGAAVAARCAEAGRCVVAYEPCGHKYAKEALGECVLHAVSLEECVYAADVVVVMNDDEAFDSIVNLLSHRHTLIDPWRRYRNKNLPHVLYVPMGLGVIDAKDRSIEDVARYWDARPCNIRFSRAPIGSVQYFNDVEKRKYFVEPHIPSFAEFERWKGKRVLEVGCGIGTDLMNFARAGAKVTAVELSRRSLELARKRAQRFNLGDRITFYSADAEELSAVVPVEQYDLIYSFGTIHHTPQPKMVIDELRAYMHPQTVLKIMMYHRYSWKVLWILIRYGKGAFWKLDRLVAEYSEAQTGCPVTHMYSKKDIRKLLDGFEIIEQQVKHIFPYSIPEYIKHEYKKVWYFRWLPNSWFRWLERRFGWHLCVTARLRDANDANKHTNDANSGRVTW